jgi:origin recognition complex subunit 5
MSAIFQLPDELIASLFESFPSRERQIRALSTLLYPHAAPCRNLVIHGAEATGKSAVTERVLQLLHEDPVTDLQYAIVRSPDCITARHLFERTIGLVADTLSWPGSLGRCETMAALTVELSKMLKYVEREPSFRFVLVFDAIDRQKEAPPTLLPALARLSEVIPSLTTVFIMTSPPPLLLREDATPHLHFTPYTKADYIAILSLDPPATLPNSSAEETADLYARFIAAVHDSLARPASRTLPSLRQACSAVWPRFTAPVATGTHRAREFSKLLISARAYFQDESVLEPGIVRSRLQSSSIPSSTTTTNGTPAASTTTTPASNMVLQKTSTTDLATLLPPTARLLLVAAYLASHNTPRHDQTLFSTWHHGRKRRGGGSGIGGATSMSSRRKAQTKHRKIARKLLGPGIFVLERMVAIYAAIRREWGGNDDSGTSKASVGTGVDGDVGMAIATLASLRLLARVGGGSSAAGDMDRGGRWRVGVGWGAVRAVGRSLGMDVEEWLIE